MKNLNTFDAFKLNTNHLNRMADIGTSSKAGSKKASSKGQASPKRVVADSLTGSSKSAPLNRLHQHLNR